jgi:hypothetical protein
VPPEKRQAFQNRYERKQCTNAIEELKSRWSDADLLVVTNAVDRCAEILASTPDSLLMHQFAGIAALRARQGAAAKEHFDTILKHAPNDAYALYGRGLVNFTGPEGAAIADPKDLSDALAFEPGVAPYYESFNLTAPDITPSKKPASRLPKPKAPPMTEGAKQIEDQTLVTLNDVDHYFGIDSDLDGEVTLHCYVGLDEKLHDCIIAAESPPNIGLGEAALFLGDRVRFKPGSFNGEPVDRTPLKYQIMIGKGRDVVEVKPKAEERRRNEAQETEAEGEASNPPKRARQERNADGVQ